MGYACAQIAGGIGGVALAHLMFGAPAFALSHKNRSGFALELSELVATTGLVSVILACVRQRPTAVAYAVGLYIASANSFTSSTSFANPAVTIARALTDTSAGIRPADAIWFIVAQLLGAVAGARFISWLIPRRETKIHKRQVGARTAGG